jgi:hypothetical protein
MPETDDQTSQSDNATRTAARVARAGDRPSRRASRKPTSTVTTWKAIPASLAHRVTGPGSA